jgi:hypothetical protein
LLEEQGSTKDGGEEQHDGGIATEVKASIAIDKFI